MLFRVKFIKIYDKKTSDIRAIRRAKCFGLLKIFYSEHSQIKLVNLIATDIFFCFDIFECLSIIGRIMKLIKIKLIWNSFI